MKLRVFFSAITLTVFWLSRSILDILYSPISANLTAQTLNGDVVDYALSKWFVAGGANNLLWVILLATLVIIWWNALVGKKNNKNSANNETQ